MIIADTASVSAPIRNPKRAPKAKPARMIGAKIGLNSPGPGSAFSAKRSTLFSATSTPSKATARAPRPVPPASNTSATKHTATNSARTNGAPAPLAASGAATSGRHNGYENAARPSRLASA